MPIRLGIVLVVWTAIWFAVRGGTWDPVALILRAAGMKPAANVTPTIPVLDPAAFASELPEDERTGLLEGLEQIETGHGDAVFGRLLDLSTRHEKLAHPLAVAYMMQGQRHFEKKEWPPAIKSFELASDFDPRSPTSKLFLARCHEAAGNAAKATAAREAASRLAGAAAPDWVGLAKALSVFLAIALLLWMGTGSLGATGASPVAPAPRPAMRAPSPPPPAAGTDPFAPRPGAPPAPGTAPAPGTPPVPGQRPLGSITKVLTADERLEQVKALFVEGLYDDADQVFKKALELNPAVSTQISKLCVDEGVRLYKAGQLDMAAQIFRQSLSYEPHSLHAHLYLANCYVKMENYAGAIEHYLQVASLNPNNATGYYNLGICYFKTQDTSNALKAFKVAVDLEALPNAHFYLAKIYEQAGDKGSAIRHWKKCIELAPDSQQAQRARRRLAELSGSS